MSQCKYAIPFWGIDGWKKVAKTVEDARTR
jgi:hypothetical protein